MPRKIRDYADENKKYQSSPKQKERRASRARARYALMKKGKVRIGDGLDVAHKDNNPLNNSPSNLAVQSKSKNRSFKRNKLGGHR